MPITYVKSSQPQETPILVDPSGAPITSVPPSPAISPVSALSPIASISPDAEVAEERRKAVDACGDLEAKISKMKKNPVIKQYEDAMAHLLSLLPDTPPNQRRSLEGDRYNAEFSEVPERSTVVDLYKIRQMLGDEVFMQLASISLQALDDYLTPEQRGSVLAYSREGKRRVKFTRR
jgi:hypothetical protein